MTVTPKKNTTVRYTTNGSKPTAKSKKISGKLTFKKPCTLRLRVSKKGATTKTYRYQVEVINKKLSSFANKLNNTELHPVKTGTYIDKEVDNMCDKPKFLSSRKTQMFTYIFSKLRRIVYA